MTNLSLFFARVRSGIITAALIVVLPAVLAGAALAQGGSGGVGPGGGSEESSVADGKFPVEGKHTYGDGLGAGRNHQGQDLMANCGKTIVAAQPGRVRLNDYQAGGAGNYLVVAGKARGSDTVYMHMRGRSKLRKGQRVEVGDVVGRVGSTGRSSACHLHFEMWSSPGWYEGGSPLDPQPSLRAWDRDH